jgi:hypothetical protein
MKNKTNANLARLNMKGMVLNNESLWIPVTISSEEVEEAIKIGTLQEEESKKLGLNDHSFSGDENDSLMRSIAAKQFEIAIRRWGGGTARIVKVNEFHSFADVGQVNARFTFDPGYGLMITKRDQDFVPMILGTGKCPNFFLMGWIIPAFAKQMVYKVHQGRCEDCPIQFGFLQEMKDHEALHVNMQMLLPMQYLNKDLLK